MASTHIGEDHNDQVSREPDVVVSHVLVDVDEDEYSRDENAEYQVSPLRDGIRRKKLREKEQVHEHHQPRKEEGK